MSHDTESYDEEAHEDCDDSCGIHELCCALESDVARLTRERDEARAALRPFARFAEQFRRQPLRGGDDVLYAIHAGTEYEAEIRRSDCEAALRIIDGDE